MLTLRNISRLCPEQLFLHVYSRGSAALLNNIDNLINLFLFLPLFGFVSSEDLCVKSTRIPMVLSESLLIFV